MLGTVSPIESTRLDQSTNTGDDNLENLSNELESLKVTGDSNLKSLWTACLDNVHKCYVPEKTAGTCRPCEEKDYKEYRLVIDRNLRNVKSMLHHIICVYNNEGLTLDHNTPEIRTFAINLLLILGEQHEKNVWNTEESVSIAKELISRLLQLYTCQSVSQILTERDIFGTVLLTLRPKLLKETWRMYPAAVASFKWIVNEVEKPTLYNYINDVLPTALIIVDDYVPENVMIGLKCLHQIVQHSHMKKGLVDTGYNKVIYHALERLTHHREAKYVLLVYSCITSLLATTEHWDNTLNVYEWTQRDDVIVVLLDNMELEQNLELRCVYMLSLPQLLTNVGCAKWCERLARILSEYCEHHTDLRTLKATLETAKTFLLMFHLRVASHCDSLYSAFLKLHFDLTKTPVFDKEIMQNLEDCICLLYKLSPNVGSAIMNDDRMHSVIRNNLQVVCLSDTKYFQ